jgi:hypothetical protein
MTSPEQLKLLSDEAERESTFSIFAEFKQWCRRLNAPGITDEAVKLIRLLNILVIDFQEGEGPLWRQDLKEASITDNDLIEVLVFLRFVQCLGTSVEPLYPVDIRHLVWKRFRVKERDHE